MTGIEALRHLAQRIKTKSTTGYVTVVANHHAIELEMIADQIERELREERDRWDGELCEAQMDKTRVMAVYLEMSRHVSGVEGVEDSPVARWARELREALGGEGHDPTNDVSMSAYDLLPKEDREAVAWVRKHGGIDHVRVEWNERVPRDRYVRRRQRLLRHIAECETALGRRNRRIEELGHRVSDLTAENAELRKRAMPEGMEWLVEAWPRFEDGGPVRVGDEFMGKDGKTYTVKQIRFMGCFFSLYDFCGEKPQFKADYGVRVKRPAPKVLDADGVEIEVGDDLYSVEGMLKFHVSSIDKKSGRIATEAMFALDKWADPKMYTHRAPVLAADGKPLREGETVYEADEGTKHVVDHIEYEGGGTPDVYFTDGKWAYPCLLTHDKPDSYDALFDDVIFKGLTREEFMRRAKALAERDAK